MKRRRSARGFVPRASSNEDREQKAGIPASGAPLGRTAHAQLITVPFDDLPPPPPPPPPPLPSQSQTQSPRDPRSPTNVLSSFLVELDPAQLCLGTRYGLLQSYYAFEGQKRFKSAR
ncbi:hypothetical protein HZH68_001921 [Vespula germanica]|uniref:Uncharacterized protein n=1 Tax=Vespula germanica TaxID=30212 RepID=A0A834NL28_VESGE|nr:hypothetical protein HZH68_001921 [Vespula germanica]